MPGKILVGTASWSDPGFIADWYPRRLPASERLPYYAEHFNLVELNSSFYAIPMRRMVERWCSQTPPDFTFDVKLHRLLSRHSTKPGLLPPALRPLAEMEGEKIQLTPKLEAAVARRFLKEIQPFYDSGKMGALLLQLSPSFGPKKNKLSELDNLLDVLKGRTIALELRNRNWVVGEQLEETIAYFKKRRLTFVAVDAPESSHFMVMPRLDLVTNPKLAYMRLHGRNVKGYISGRTVAERFNYQYSEQELQETALRAAEMAEEARETHIIYNNNASDYALRAASRFRAILAENYPEVSTPISPNQNLRQKTLVRADQLGQTGRESRGKRNSRIASTIRSHSRLPALAQK